MSTVTIVLLVILVVLVGLLIGLYFFGKKTQKKQEEQQAQIEASKQTVSMLVIDKKRLPLKQSGLPQMVIDQTPKLLRRSKLPIVKAKVGPKISILIADEKVFDLIPVKKEVLWRLQSRRKKAFLPASKKTKLRKSSHSQSSPANPQKILKLLQLIPIQPTRKTRKRNKPYFGTIRNVYTLRRHFEQAKAVYKNLYTQTCFPGCIYRFFFGSGLPGSSISSIKQNDRSFLLPE